MPGTICHRFMSILSIYENLILGDRLHNKRCNNFKNSIEYQFWCHISILKAVLAIEKLATKVAVIRSTNLGITCIKDFEFLMLNSF